MVNISLEYAKRVSRASRWAAVSGALGGAVAPVFAAVNGPGGGGGGGGSSSTTCTCSSCGSQPAPPKQPT